MELRETIAKRYSCRSYAPEQISEEDLNFILQAGNAAPVGMGKFETVKFTVIQNRELLDRIDTEGSKFFGDPQAHPLYGAPTLILVSVKADEAEVGMCNASCIIENMTLAATDLGLGSCYIRGNIVAIRDNEEICRQMKVPTGFMPAGALAVGHTEDEKIARKATMEKIAVEYVR